MLLFLSSPVTGPGVRACFSSNPSPLARDLWQIPIGNDAVGISRIALE